MVFIRNNFKYLILFLVFLFLNLCCNPLNGDEIWSFGFSNNIVRGLVPYRDFNMIITPFYPMFMSLFLFIFGSNLLVFHIVHAFIITFTIFIIFKLIDNKTWLVLCLFVLLYIISFPNYNFLIFSFFIILLYLEKENKNDYLIGVVLALTFLTKQHVGFMLLFASLYYIKDLSKIGKRCVGFLIPNFVFFIYLIVTNSFSTFVDLCFLGLFNFGRGNGTFFNLYFVFAILLILIILITICFKRKEISLYYLLLFGSIMIPIFDYYHFMFFLIAFAVVYFMIFPFKNRVLEILGVIVFFELCVLQIIFSGFSLKNYPNDLKYFEYRNISSGNIDFIKVSNNIYQKYNHKVVFFGYNSYIIKIINDEDSGYLDLINVGNYGYQGSSKVILEIKKLGDDYVFAVEKQMLEIDTQLDYNVYKYIKKNGELIEEDDVFLIYRFK